MTNGQRGLLLTLCLLAVVVGVLLTHTLVTMTEGKPPERFIVLGAVLIIGGLLGLGGLVFEGRK